MSAVTAILGKLPTPEEYLQFAGKLDTTASDTYRYLNFDELQEYVDSANKVDIPEDVLAAARQQLA